ncbi:FadR/GntR family transcriptional regulator [Leekyejoonella antrihumi]|nr:FCD domain-containing protein [Leekyejoonella antrihumi]
MSIARRLIEAIEAGRYPVRSRLPVETELARRFGASRVSVREALSALQFAGYVESRRGSGTTVLSATPRYQSTARFARRLPADHLQLLEARLVLEPQTIALGACDPDPVALRAARKLVDAMALVVSAPDIDVNTDLQVHTALVETCRNSYLVGQCRGLLEAASGDYYRNARTQAWQDVDLLDSWASEHRRTWEAVASGDAVGAMRSSREHLLSVVHRFATDESLSTTDRARMTAIHAQFSTVDLPIRARVNLHPVGPAEPAGTGTGTPALPIVPRPVAEPDALPGPPAHPSS